jgi:hypothetical protein
MSDKSVLREIEPHASEEIRRWVAAEVPFVVRGLCLDWPAIESWDFRSLSAKLHGTPGKVYKAWFRTTEGELSRDIPTKEPLRRILYDGNNFQIAENMAIWLSAQRNVTMLHYDGYSFDGFNVQVSGEKTFDLYHPDLECLMAPFTQGALKPTRQVPSHSVEMKPGDCLYTPRFWYHTVRARTDATNVQYHFARKTPPSVESRAMRHYINNCWIVRNIPRVIPRSVRQGISEYPEIVQLYAAKARPTEAVAQVTKATLQLSALLVSKPGEMLKLMRHYNRKSVDELSRLI